ncbi:MAG: hypothetical protein ABIQ32_04380 [Sphingomicrobium sp.]
MSSYRSHLTRWYITSRVFSIGFGAMAVTYNVAMVTIGLRIGVIESLRRHSHDLVRVDVNPYWFAFNIAVRALWATLFALAVVILWRKMRRELRRGVADKESA